MTNPMKLVKLSWADAYTHAKEMNFREGPVYLTIDGRHAIGKNKSGMYVATDIAERKADLVERAQGSFRHRQFTVAHGRTLREVRAALAEASAK